MKLCHNIQSPLRVGKTKTIESRGDSNSFQTGGGSNADDADDEESITHSEQSTKIGNSKMRICNICSRVLSTPFNLRRHMKLCHNIQEPLRVGKTKSIERWDDSNSSQTGRGFNADDDDEESITDSEQSTKTDDSDTNDDEGSQTNEDVDDDENWVFKRFFDELTILIDGFETLSLEQRQKLFRDFYTKFLIWNYHLRRNPVYKKIMETIQD